MRIEDIGKRIEELHEKYDAFDAKLDKIETAKVASKLTPVYSIGLLILVFWVGTWF